MINIVHPQASLAFISIFTSSSVHTPFYIQCIYSVLLVLFFSV